MRTFGNHDGNLIFSKSFFRKLKKCFHFHNFGWMWLVNELVLKFSAPLKYAKAQFNPIILSRLIEYAIYRQTVKTVFSDWGSLKT